MCDRIFVYGTLMQGERRHRVLEPAEVVPGVVRGRLVNLGPFPAFVRSDDMEVRGELVTLANPAHTIPSLDDIEGNWGSNPLYRREMIDVRTETGDVIPAWVYVYNRNTEGFPTIESGDWRARQ
jgi:gamma-glutamylcyclotransferase (GGCT)/AIG2-like uncharacterized protein YtfP